MKIVDTNINGPVIVLSISIAIILSLLSANLIILISTIILSLLIFIYGRKIAIVVVLLSFLTATTKFIGDFRIYINIFNLFILGYLFFKDYGVNFSKYPQFPPGINLFLSSLFICLTFSSIFSKEPLTGFYSIGTTVFFYIICYLFYALIDNGNNIYLYIYSIIFVSFVLSINIFVDLFRLGPTEFFIRGVINDEIELYSMIRYTELVIFFISLTLLIALGITNQSNKNLVNIIIVLLVLYFIVVLVLANSRGGILGAVLSSTFLLLVIKGRKFIRLLLFTAVVLFIFFSSYSELFDAVETYLRFETIGEREIFWQSGIDIFNDYPIFGIGPNHYPKYFGTYAPANIYEQIGFNKLTNPTPHNLFLRYAAENGIFGLFVSISFFVMFFFIAIRTMRITKNTSREYFILSTSIAGIGIGLLFRAFVEVTGILSYGYITLDLPFWLVFIILISIYQKFNLQIASHSSIFKS